MKQLLFFSLLNSLIYLYLFNYFKSFIYYLKIENIKIKEKTSNNIRAFIKGIITIRVFKQEEFLDNIFIKLLQENYYKSFALFSTVRLLNFSLELFSILFIPFYFLIINHFSKDISQIGNSLIAIISMSEIIQFIFITVINTNLIMQNVGKILKYTNYQQEKIFQLKNFKVKYN